MKRRRPLWTTTTRSRRSIARAAILFVCLQSCLRTFVSAQTDNSTIITTCESGSNSVSFTVPTTTAQDAVDVFFLFDDTGTFIAASSTVARTFSTIISELTTSYPSVSWGFGVGKYEDYGGPGIDYNGANTVDRPFILNQPIIDSETAGGQDILETIVKDALNVRSPGNGGDLPEAGIEGLYQVAVGSGFDGNGDGLFTGIDGSQTAGTIATQQTPDDSGDVPPFGSLDASVLSAGSVGGAGFRPGALKLVIIATDVCSASAFTNETRLDEDVTSIFATVPASDFACLGDVRFGVVGTSKTKAETTLSRSVVPLDGHTVDETVAALVGAGIQVIGLVTGSGALEPGQGPNNIPGAYVTAMSRLTGAVDSSGVPLVYQITPDDLDGMVSAITSAVTLSLSDPVNVTLVPDDECDSIDGLIYTISPDPAANIQPGVEVSFEVTLTIDPSVARGNCQLAFVNSDTGELLSPNAVELSVCEDISAEPSQFPTITPTTSLPTFQPTETPTELPTGIPSLAPVVAPTATPTVRPTVLAGTPTTRPIATTGTPTEIPSVTPSAGPTIQLTAGPTTLTGTPTVSLAPSSGLTSVPTNPPDSEPVRETERPTATPTARAMTGMMTSPKPSPGPTRPPKMSMPKTSRPTPRPKSPTASRPTGTPMIRTQRPSMMPSPKRTTSPTVSLAPSGLPPRGMGFISLFGRTTGAMFTRGTGITTSVGGNMVSNSMRPMIMNGIGNGNANAMRLMKIGNAMRVSGNGGGDWGFDNGGSGGQWIKGGKTGSIKGSKSYSIKGYVSKGYYHTSAKSGSKIKGIKGRTNSGQQVGGIYSHGAAASSTMQRPMRMRMAMRPKTDITTATVSEKGFTIIFRPDEADADASELKTKFTGTLIGYRAFT